MVQVGLTREQFEAKAGLLRQRGIEIDGDRGVLAKDGCKVSYEYDGTTLTCIVQSHPFFLNATQVESQLRTWLSD